jgi:hypothetical protein
MQSCGVSVRNVMLSSVPKRSASCMHRYGAGAVSRMARLLSVTVDTDCHAPKRSSQAAPALAATHRNDP